ncbi:MAG TPA: hypothetical protein VH250_11740 [Granulicella sp.]|jgi:hypothetical protein|nr:hypothetical protein [Granulicella sp.]
MRIPLTPTLAASLLAATLSFGGCNKSSPAPASANPQNPAAQTQPTPQNQTAQTQNQNPGTLNSDGTRTTPAASTQPPSSSAAAPAPPPPTQAAQPAPPPPPPPPPTIPAGAQVTVRVTERLSASHNEVGDPFSGALAEPLVHHRTVVFPRGTRVAGTVVAAKGRGRFKGSGALAIELTSIGGIRVHTSEYEQEEKGRGKRSAGLIGGGGGLGAIIGGVAGGGKGALIGGLAGAGAGSAGAAFTGKRDVIIPSESLVTFQLTAPLTREAR